MKLFSSIGKWPPLGGIQTDGVGLMVAGSLITLRKTIETLSSIRTREPPARGTNGKATFRATIGSFGLKCGTLFGSGKRSPSFGLFSIKQLQSTNGGPALPQPPFQSNVSSASQILANRSNINYVTAIKLGELGDGLPSSCMNFVGFAWATTIASTGNKLYLGKGFPKNTKK
jgi:hypothetical protein